MLMLLKISSGTGENLLSETGTSHSSFYPKSQLLTIAIPKLEEMQKDGPDGRKKLAAITRYVTVALALKYDWGTEALGVSEP